MKPKSGTCEICLVTHSPRWRTGPHGSQTLCNKCGIKYARIIKNKNNINTQKPAKVNETQNNRFRARKQSKPKRSCIN